MSIRDAMAGGGALMTGAALLLGVVMGDATRPATTVIDQVASSPSFNPCPAGWAYNRTDEHDHGQLASCSQNGWVVVLDQNYAAEYGLNTLNPFAEPVPPSEVPGWR